MEHPLSTAQLRALRQCASKTPVKRNNSGNYSMGSKRIALNLIHFLEARDLVSIDSEQVCITQAGKALLKRQMLAKATSNQAFAHQHRQLCKIYDPESDQALLINLAESPLKRLAGRKGRDGKRLLSAVQVEAGERLREDFETCGLRPRITRDYETMQPGRCRPGPPGLQLVDLRLDAKRRYEQAVAAVGPGLSEILVRVCCWLEGVEQAERDLGWPVRSGKLVLSIALDRLSDHYSGKK